MYSQFDIFPPAADPESEALILNANALTNFTTGIRTEVAAADGDFFEFSSNALWIAFKFATHLAFIRNDSPGSIDISWTKSDGGNGLSHITEFGTAVIPLPAGGVLLLTALGGLGIAARRRRKAQAA